MTLLEVAVWVTVFTFTMIAVMSSVIYFYRTNGYTIEQASAVSSAQRGIDKMVRTIREAAYASDGAYPVVSMAANDVRFYADVDSDAFAEQVHYFLLTKVTASGTTTSLMEGIINPSGDPPVYTGTEASTTLSEYVRNIDVGVATTTFRYYNKTGVEITDLTKVADVRFITTTMLIDVDPKRSPTPLVLRSSAALRNLIGK